MERVNSKLMSPFWRCENIHNTYKSGRKKLLSWKLFKLDGLCEAVLDVSLEDTSLDDFTIACSFLNNVMKIAGYGRAFRYASSPRNRPEN